jgi:DNA-binding transcriptional MerR regulator
VFSLERKEPANMQIGAVARRTGLSPDTIRFYERNALLLPPRRTPAGYRSYVESDVETLGFVRRAQSLGFTLAEIRQLLALRRSPLQPCAPVRRRLGQKLRDVRAKFADLRRLEAELAAALRACARTPRRRSPRCPLLSEEKFRGTRTEK